MITKGLSDDDGLMPYMIPERGRIFFHQELSVKATTFFLLHVLTTAPGNIIPLCSKRSSQAVFISFGTGTPRHFRK